MRRPRHIRPYGPTALLLEWESRIDEGISRGVHAYAAAMGPHPAVVECVPGYASLLVAFDPTRTTAADFLEWAYALRPAPGETPTGQRHRVPVRYDGPDLPAVAEMTGLTVERIAALHTAPEYLVYLLGYRPGFAFLGPTPQELSVPRRAAPRPSVPSGAVGLAGRQTGVYPGNCPGGWQLIGRCPLPLLAASGAPVLRPGDRVRFVAVDAAEFERLSILPAWPDDW